MAVLDLMPAAQIRVNRLTVKRLMRDGLVERDLDSEYEVDWQISRAGREVLAVYPDVLAAAGRRINAIQANQVLGDLLRRAAEQ